MTLYKLTDKNYRTKNNTAWGENITHTALGAGTPELCTNTVIHAYEDPILAILMNPAHGRYNPVILWEASGDILISDGTKCGCKSLTTVKKLPLTLISTASIVAFGILCALEVYKEKKFVIWAHNWLDDIDRAANAADAVANYAVAIYAVANYAVANYAAANYAAANAAKAANYVAKYAANAAANYAADAAANYAADAAANAAKAEKINFIKLAHKALEII